MLQFFRSDLFLVVVLSTFPCFLLLPVLLSYRFLGLTAISGSLLTAYSEGFRPCRFSYLSMLHTHYPVSPHELVFTRTLFFLVTILKYFSDLRLTVAMIEVVY